MLAKQTLFSCVKLICEKVTSTGDLLKLSSRFGIYLRTNESVVDPHFYKVADPHVRGNSVIHCVADPQVKGNKSVTPRVTEVNSNSQPAVE